jgi:hypothetical protein
MTYGHTDVTCNVVSSDITPPGHQQIVYIIKGANVILFKLLTQCTWKIKFLALIFRKKNTYRIHFLGSTVLFQKVNYFPIR